MSTPDGPKLDVLTAYQLIRARNDWPQSVITMTRDSISDRLGREYPEWYTLRKERRRDLVTAVLNRVMTKNDISQAAWTAYHASPTAQVDRMFTESSTINTMESTIQRLNREVIRGARPSSTPSSGHADPFHGVPQPPPPRPPIPLGTVVSKGVPASGKSGATGGHRQPSFGHMLRRIGSTISEASTDSAKKAKVAVTDAGRKMKEKTVETFSRSTSSRKDVQGTTASNQKASTGATVSTKSSHSLFHKESSSKNMPPPPTQQRSQQPERRAVVRGSISRDRPPYQAPDDEEDYYGVSPPRTPPRDASGRATTTQPQPQPSSRPGSSSIQLPTRPGSRDQQPSTRPASFSNPTHLRTSSQPESSPYFSEGSRGAADSSYKPSAASHRASSSLSSVLAPRPEPSHNRTASGASQQSTRHSRAPSGASQQSTRQHGATGQESWQQQSQSTMLPDPSSRLSYSSSFSAPASNVEQRRQQPPRGVPANRPAQPPPPLVTPAQQQQRDQVEAALKDNPTAKSNRLAWYVAGPGADPGKTVWDCPLPSCNFASDPNITEFQFRGHMMQDREHQKFFANGRYPCEHGCAETGFYDAHSRILHYAGSTCRGVHLDKNFLNNRPCTYDTCAKKPFTPAALPGWVQHWRVHAETAFRKKHFTVWVCNACGLAFPAQILLFRHLGAQTSSGRVPDHIKGMIQAGVWNSPLPTKVIP